MSHWDTLLSLQKPTVEFFSSREALEVRHAPPAGTTSVPMTPDFSGNSPRAFGVSSLMGTPIPPNSVTPMQMASSPFNGMQSLTQAITPRFGMMGIGAPQGSQQSVTPDLLAWDGQAPEAPRDYRPVQYQPIRPAEERSCCQGPSSPLPTPQYVQYAPDGQMPGLPQQANFVPFPPSMMSTVSIPEPELLPRPTQAALDFDKFNNDYFNYQFPSAICQTCGLSGCTCRNCPPVMQNANNGSWAQCCGRKHARTAAYVAPAAVHTYHQQPPLQPEEQFGVQAMQLPLPVSFQHQHSPLFPEQPPFPDEPHSLQPVDLQSPQAMPDFMPFDPGEDFTIPEGANNMDLSDLLLSDLERPSSGCCCGDP
ncbi:hypothetical protein LTR65_001942 [Meristemomyces frigidus]